MMKITYDGMREASHLTKMTSLVIDKAILFNILIKRLLNNPDLIQHYAVDADACRSDIDQQKQFFANVFPENMEELGETLPTFQWIISRISDGNDVFTPRELIYFLNQAKEQQIEMLEMGHKIVEDKIFAPNALKRAIRDVSKAKYERTLMAENPDLVDNFKKFRNARPEISTEWMRSMLRDRDGKKLEDVDLFANSLSDIGFLKRVSESQWRIPYLYQYALGIAPEE